MILQTNVNRFIYRKREIGVESKKVTKSNLKGIAKLVGGLYYPETTAFSGSEKQIIPAHVRIQLKPVGTIYIYSNDIVYRVGKSKVWRRATTAEFNRKFKVI